jgi:hypothetical protein
VFEIEPSSDIRQLALGIRQLYVALVGSGFSHEDAMMLVCVMIGNRHVGEFE